MEEINSDEKLPYWTEMERGAPNSILRSALFGMVERSSTGRKEYNHEIIASYGGTKFYYTGESLSQNDLDIFLEALHIWMSTRIPTMELTRYRISKLLQKSPSKPLYRRIDDSLERLFNCSLEIKINRTDGKIYRYKGRLITELESISDKGKMDWRITINTKLIELFSHGYTKQILDIRKSLRGDLSRWFYGYIESHRATEDNPHKISFEKLIPMMGVSSHRTMFKKGIIKALEQLKEQYIIEKYEITDSDVLIVVKRDRYEEIQ